MRYMQAYRFVFNHPQWVSNVLFGALCMIIPAVGPIVLMGWLYEVIERFLKDGEGQYPAFDFNRFGEYLGRGVWPFLVSLVLGLLMVPVILVFQVAFFAIMAGSKGEPDPAIFIGLMGLMMLVIVVMSLGMTLVQTPMLLRAGLAGEFKAAFDRAFVVDFIKKMWKEMILSALFLIGTSLLLSLVGLALCCVGVYPVAAIVSMAQYHLQYQIYDLYLKRGGMPIPLKPDTVQPA